MIKKRGKSILIAGLLSLLNFSPILRFIATSNGKETISQTSIEMDVNIEETANRDTGDQLERGANNDIEPCVPSGSKDNVQNVTQYDYSTINGGVD